MQNAAFAGILFFRNKAKTASDRFYKLCAEIFCIGVCKKFGYRAKAEKAAYREEREKKELEGKISEIEGEVKELEAYFSSGEYKEIEKKSKEYEEKKALLGNLEERYLELLEKEI